MSVTVHDILQLDILKHARLIAGKKGLLRHVMRVNFTDCPLEGDLDYALVTKGDLYIKSFYMDKDDEQKIYDYIQFYIKTESSCCITLDQYVKEFPKKALLMADRAGYPIIVVEPDTPYGDLIREISELIMTEQSGWISENKINRILFDTLGAEELADITGYLFPELKGPFTVIYITFPELTAARERLLKNNLWLQFKLRLLPYLKGGFIAADDGRYPDINTLLTPLSCLISGLVSAPVFSPGSQNTDCRIGVSGKCADSQNLRDGLSQSLSACEIGKLLNKQLMHYDNLSVYNLLLSVKNQDVLGRYCEQVLGPLKKYEMHHSLNLLETVSVYLANNGDYKKTAAQLSQHENTIRFRINKAKALLGMETQPYMFIEQMSLALKAEKIRENHFTLRY